MKQFDRSGVEFQQFIAFLERLLSSREGARIESPKYVADRDTGRSREHDVVITWVLGHHHILTAIECRDGGRKVGVPAVEQFAKKCEKTGIHHGVIVSSSGFTSTAKTKASALDIALMTFGDAEVYDWVPTEFVVRIISRGLHITSNVVCPTAPPDSIEAIYTSAGERRDSESLSNEYQMALDYLYECDDAPPDARQKFEEGECEIHYRPDSVGWYAVDRHGNRHDIEQVYVTGRYVTTTNETESDRFSYGGDDAAYVVNSNQFEVDDAPARLVMVEAEGGVRGIALESQAHEGRRIVPMLDGDRVVFVSIDESDYNDDDWHWAAVPVEVEHVDGPPPARKGSKQKRSRR